MINLQPQEVPKKIVNRTTKKILNKINKLMIQNKDKKN